MNRWWKRHGSIAGKTFGWITGYASLASLVIMFTPPLGNWAWYHYAIAAASLIATAFACVAEFMAHSPPKMYDLQDRKSIKKYMHNGIESGGRVAIWTRDLSWAVDVDTISLLKAKAKANELILCMPERTDLARELEKCGAEVCAYGSDLYDSPSSRFTIANFSRDGATVAVGRAEARYHVIEEFSMGHHPAYRLSRDLVELARGLQRKS